MNNAIVLSVSDFVALVNQTLEYAYGSVTVVGELANFRVSKNKWVYFDLKDELSSVRFFGTVYALPGPLEDGMMLEVHGTPRLHPQFGFSITVQSLRPVGAGTIKQAAQLLEAKLAAEGLFAAERKRPLPYPPTHIGLITSVESAAYADFCKVSAARWRGLRIDVADVHVQGEQAPEQIVRAIAWSNQQAAPPEVLVLIRGGGSADDLQAFSIEQVVRAVAGSRIPTLVAIGHEIDTSLAELAADQRASTPSNAAELLVPDRRELQVQLSGLRSQLDRQLQERLAAERTALQQLRLQCGERCARVVVNEQRLLDGQRRLLTALNPAAALQRGFAIVRGSDGRVIRRAAQVADNAIVEVEISDARFGAAVQAIRKSHA